MKRFFDVLASLVATLFIFGMMEGAVSWNSAVLSNATQLEQIDAKTSLTTNAVLLILLINLGWLRRNDT